MKKFLLVAIGLLFGLFFKVIVKKISFIVFGVLSSLGSSQNCFVAQTAQEIIVQEGDSNVAYAPCSTFKIPLALMGFDSGILTDATHPVRPFQPGYVDCCGAWKENMTPTTWIKESSAWYSQVLTQKLGMPVFQNYVTQFDYGNMDVSGDKGQNNGLSQSWLGSSLRISSAQQCTFLQQMLAGKWPIKPQAYAMTKQILFVEELKNGWTLYGKTGMGNVIEKDGRENPLVQHGWFVGWIEKGDQYIVFSNHVVDEIGDIIMNDVLAGRRARADAITRLSKIIDGMGDESEKEQKEVAQAAEESKQQL